MSKTETNDKLKLDGRFRIYISIPIIMGVFLIGMCIWVYSIGRKAGFALSLLTMGYIVVVLALYIYSRNALKEDMIAFSTRFGMLQNELMGRMSLPYAMLSGKGKVLWMNDAFEAIFGDVLEEDPDITGHIMSLTREVLPQKADESFEMEVRYLDREYMAKLRGVALEGMQKTEWILNLMTSQNYVIAVSLQDVTELKRLKRENEEQRLVAGLIYIDNFDEVMGSVEEARQSLLLALVDRKINQYISKKDGIVKRLENDKYFIVIKKQCFKEIEEDRFSLLEDVKSVALGNGGTMSLSIGLGLSKDSYEQCYNYARVAIDLALARGGDQAVIKDSDGITYYGGKNEMQAKSTRVKARVKAEALRELLTVNDSIFIMGHKMGDADSLGAAMGIYRAAKSLGKNAHVVINEISASLKPLYNLYADEESYPEDMFMEPEEAVVSARADSLVVVVDVNRPKMTECEELLRMCKTVVVLDHHRQSFDHIENTVLSYIEPYASSASEMVAEVLQYIADDIRISRLEASGLYAGIMIDTSNFAYRSGVRTFEAAAFLKRKGADTTLIRKIFRDDMDAYRAKAEIIASATVYREKFAVAIGTGLEVESPTIIGAQAANELLDINEIKASFVLTEYNGRIYISARSIDEVNVQIVMERLGGGGHANAAGAQFDHTDMKEAEKTLKETIDLMLEKGDI